MLSNRSGQALVLVLLMTTFIFMVGGAALALGTTTRRNAALDIFQKKAYYIAEAGVEKALARAKSDPGWVARLPLRSDFTNTSDELFLPENIPYDENGIIEQVRVIKTGEDAAGKEVYLKIKSVGRTQQSSRTLVVEATVIYPFPREVFKGFWVNRLEGLPQGHGVNFSIDTYITEEDLTLPKDSVFDGKIFCKGKVILDGARSHQVSIGGKIYALGGVELSYVTNLNNNSNLTIYVDSSSKVNLHEGVTVNYQVVVLPTQELLSKMPPSPPELLNPERLNWYRVNTDFTHLPADLKFKNGIYYIKGNVEFAGTYSGQALVVVEGGVTIGSGRDKYLKREREDDCLIILATGEVKTHNAHINPIEAFLYSGTGIRLQNGAGFTGGLISPQFDANGNTISVTQDESILRAYEQSLTWSTSEVKITKWVG
ncbi:hypothetical protein Desku_1977 [Desulfofundulus kuznetsovii DSM 6115]|uniref:Type 4 fimbrial biogenesis protein PilX N-terminal domain-containing protein n=1 Tax=Desulfofundulus kuznetsovii (strain DSM 6115 / VKM B-1805 / 17) TaxID=760568 RepID=A0AAU8PU29_DESK7|nr:hypothetical protein Desku_1977 [Desulfofundulus kuznetsovii DSM 6115]